MNERYSNKFFNRFILPLLVSGFLGYSIASKPNEIGGFSYSEFQDKKTLEDSSRVADSLRQTAELRKKGIKIIETTPIHYSPPKDLSQQYEDLPSVAGRDDYQNPVEENTTTANYSTVIKALALEDKLTQAQRDSSFELNARDSFLSEISNLWFTHEIDSTTGDLHFCGISPTNNPRGLRHPDNTEKAHTAGAIPYQLISSEGIKKFVTMDNLKEIGRASLQSAVINPNYKVSEDEVEIDPTTFDIRYIGKERENFIPGSLTRKGEYLVLFRDAPGQITTPVVVPVEVYGEIYQEKLDYDAAEKQKMLDSLRATIKPDTIRISGKLSQTKRKQPIEIFLQINGTENTNIGAGIAFPIGKFAHGLLVEYNPRQNTDSSIGKYVESRFNSGDYISRQDSIDNVVSGFGTSLYISFDSKLKLPIEVNASAGLYWGKEKQDGVIHRKMYSEDGSKIYDTDDSKVNKKISHKPKPVGSLGVQYRTPWNQGIGGFVRFDRKQKPSYGVRVSQVF